MSEISRFCEERMVSPRIEETFTMYCRSIYASKFSLRNGDTVKLFVSKMTREQVEEAWSDFVSDLKSVIA